MSINFSPAIVRHGVFHSLRFEVAAVLLFGVVVPFIGFLIKAGHLSTNFSEVGGWLMRPKSSAWMFQPAIVNSLVGVVVCSLLSLAILRRLRLFPGVAVARSILPVVSVVFGIFITIITSFRLEYSNKLILSCFLSVLLARFAITAVRSRAKGIVYALVPGGKVDLVRELRAAPVLELKNPSLLGVPDCAVVADLYADLAPEWERFLAEAAISGRSIYHYKQVWEAETGRVQIEHLSENGFGALVPSLAYQKMKRGIDILLSIVAIPIVVPIITICAIAIKLDKGPVFFRQRRMGFRGKEFFVLKLRTMTEGHAGDDRELSITQSGDKRITKVGGFLRRTRLDEVPQIINILRGEMSWIGPRPEAASLSSWYEGEIPFYRYRHIVRPGISGWAQVNQGHVSNVDEVEEKLQYDFYYIKNLSYWLDIIIALRTAKVILSGFGSK